MLTRTGLARVLNWLRNIAPGNCALQVDVEMARLAADEIERLRSEIHEWVCEKCNRTWHYDSLVDPLHVTCPECETVTIPKSWHTVKKMDECIKKLKADAARQDVKIEDLYERRAWWVEKAKGLETDAINNEGVMVALREGYTEAKAKIAEFIHNENEGPQGFHIPYKTITELIEHARQESDADKIGSEAYGRSVGMWIALTGISMDIEPCPKCMGEKIECDQCNGKRFYVKGEK